MTVKFNAQGAERKRLVQAISKWLDLPSEYLGAPTFEYKVGSIVIDKNGTLSFEGNLREETIEALLSYLYDENFDIDMSEPELEQLEGLCIIIPRNQLDDEDLKKLKILIKVKGPLLCKALNIDSLPLEVTDTKIKFNWFIGSTTPDEFDAYSTLIFKLCDMVKKQKRINITEKPVTNEKYAFRCFLLRLGFIGDEYKSQRKILLRHLSGSSAFKEVKKDENSK